MGGVSSAPDASSPGRGSSDSADDGSDGGMIVCLVGSEFGRGKGRGKVGRKERGLGVGWVHEEADRQATNASFMVRTMLWQPSGSTDHKLVAGFLPPSRCCRP